MGLKIVDATVSSFNEVFSKFKEEAANNKASFILFLADKDPSTNLSWCPGNFLSFDFSLPFLFVIIE